MPSMYEEDSKCIYANIYIWLHLTSFFLTEFVTCMTTQTILEFKEVSEKKHELSGAETLAIGFYM